MSDLNSSGRKMIEKECLECGKQFMGRKTVSCCSTKCGLKFRDKRIDNERQAVERAAQEKYERFIGRLSDVAPRVPHWSADSKKTTAKLAVPVAFLSDCHFDEVVKPEEVNHVNAYNRTIAEKRLRKFFESCVVMGKRYSSGLSYPGIVVPLGGDIFSGSIHEELARTNEDSMSASLVHWLGQLQAGIRMLAEEYGKVYLPCVVGNHGRNTMKPINKGRVRDNWDWLLYRLLETNLAGDKRIQLAVSESSDFTFSIFGTTYLLTHGDRFRGGSGISGILTPITLGDHRTRKRSASVRQPYDYLIIGHFHKLMSIPGAIVNGSMKGFDEYSLNSNFDYQPPQQAWWLTSREWKMPWSFSPLHVCEASDPYSGSNVANRTASNVAFAA